ncbi:hypothetical protein BDA99DRAFT_539390 [Phascolomyces articulosus]|uniref:Uncharacterized protein n=1 Tax=Phascolomyces articulosus TaxID=60185 RepID=A0AAD5K6A3_9FUNG|nr:hypothetical protein BDA99DRAFT_539390 [Phascolomyces articulosus]
MTSIFRQKANVLQPTCMLILHAPTEKIPSYFYAFGRKYHTEVRIAANLGYKNKNQMINMVPGCFTESRNRILTDIMTTTGIHFVARMFCIYQKNYVLKWIWYYSRLLHIKNGNLRICLYIFFSSLWMLIMVY